MGRRRNTRVYSKRFGLTEMSRDRGNPGNTAASVGAWSESSQGGPMAAALWEAKMLRYDQNGDYVVDRAAVKREVEAIKAEVISNREYPRAEYARMASESTGLPERAAVNVDSRTMQARAAAVTLAARVGGVEISPADKRVINPIREGRYLQVVYGKQSQHDDGTLSTRLKAARRPKLSDSDRARAEERLKYLKGHEYRDSWAA